MSEDTDWPPGLDLVLNPGLNNFKARTTRDGLVQFIRHDDWEAGHRNWGATCAVAHKSKGTKLKMSLEQTLRNSSQSQAVLVACKQIENDPVHSFTELYQLTIYLPED